MSGIVQKKNIISIGNHNIQAEKITKTKYKIFVLNPIANHRQHNNVKLSGIYELRLAKVWGGGYAD